MKHRVPERMAEQVAEMASSCGRLLQQNPEPLKEIVRFVEQEMKGQHLPEQARDRDEFVASTFHQMYPKVLESETCRNAVEQMLKMQEPPGESPFTLREQQPQYSIDSALADALFATGSAIMGSILLVTAGESGGAIRDDGERGYEV